MVSKLKPQTNIYLFGEKSKFANWVLNHPIHIAAGCTLACCLLIIGDGDSEKQVRALQIIPLFFFGLAFLVRFLCRNLCYWVEIDTQLEKIKFFKCFNKGIVEFPIQSVSFRFDKHFAAFYAGERFTIFNEYMAGIAELLPPEKEIEFSRGLYGRYMKWMFERNRKVLK